MSDVSIGMFIHIYSIIYIHIHIQAHVIRLFMRVAYVKKMKVFCFTSDDASFAGPPDDAFGLYAQELLAPLMPLFKGGFRTSGWSV